MAVIYVNGYLKMPRTHLAHNEKIMADAKEHLRSALEHFKPGFEDVLANEMLRGERRRAVILVIITGIIVLWLLLAPLLFENLFSSLAGQSVHGLTFFNLLALAFSVLGIYEFGFSLILSFYIARSKNFPVPPRYANAAVEITFISAIIYFMSKTNIGYEALYSPTIFIYFIFIALSAFRLKLPISVFTGFLAFIEYLGLYYLIILQSRPDIAQMMLFAPGLHIARASFFLLSGVVTGFVSVQIRKSMLNSILTLEERNAIINLFGQYVSPSVANKLLEHKGDVKSELKTVCVMFLDIRSFTRFCEDKQPADVINFLNYVFSFMIEIINEHNGIINKFLGDGFMAIFGAPLSDGRDCVNAVRAALLIRKKLRDEIAARNIPDIKIGIGLHVGEVITGHVGSSNRKEYTVIGDVVNLASRIEQLNKQFNSEILASEEVWKYIQDDGFDAENLGIIDVRGRAEGVRLFRLA